MTPPLLPARQQTQQTRPAHDHRCSKHLGNASKQSPPASKQPAPYACLTP